MLRVLEVPGAFLTFLLRRVYGGPGNAHRHGRADAGQRRQALFLVVALAGLLEGYAGVTARAWLAASLERELSSA